MPLKEISKDTFDVSALLDETLGKEGTPEREKNRERAWEEYNAQILLDARKNAHLTQAELARRIGADKGYSLQIARSISPAAAFTDKLFRLRNVGWRVAARGYTVRCVGTCPFSVMRLVSESSLGPWGFPA